MSDRTMTKTDEPGGNYADRLKDADWSAYGKHAVAATIGITLNGIILSILFNVGDPTGLAAGVITLAPALILASMLFHRHNPADHPWLGTFILIITLLGANALTLTLRAFAGPMANPMGSVLVAVGAAVMFTPGPAIAVWAARRWWL